MGKLVEMKIRGTPIPASPPKPVRRNIVVAAWDFLSSALRGSKVGIHVVESRPTPWNHGLDLGPMNPHRNHR